MFEWSRIESEKVYKAGKKDISAIDKIVKAVSDTDFEIIKRMMNYRINSERLKKVAPIDDRYPQGDGWMAAKDISKGIIDKSHRFTYLKNRTFSGYFLQSVVVRFKDNRNRVTKRGLTLYRLNPSMAIQLFKVIYLKGKVWETYDSDYLNDHFWIQIRLTLLNTLKQKKVGKLNRKNSALIMFDYNTLKEASQHHLVMSPTMLYFLLTKRDFPEGVDEDDLQYSFLLYDYMTCPEEYFREKIRTTINYIKGNAIGKTRNRNVRK